MEPISPVEILARMCAEAVERIETFFGRYEWHPASTEKPPTPDEAYYYIMSKRHLVAGAYLALEAEHGEGTEPRERFGVRDVFIRFVHFLRDVYAIPPHVSVPEVFD